jgi:hypothetical protein
VECLSLMDDIVFKSVFGRSTAIPILIPLLNAVLGYRNGDRIKEALIVNPFHYGACGVYRMQKGRLAALFALVPLW